MADAQGNAAGAASSSGAQQLTAVSNAVSDPSFHGIGRELDLALAIKSPLSILLLYICKFICHMSSSLPH